LFRSSKTGAPPGKADISTLVTQNRPAMSDYEDLYRTLHVNPELSLQESTTARTVAHRLSLLTGLEVRTNIGGHGVVGILRNGEGKTVLLRADMDALPLEEQTGLKYASTKRMVDVTDGVEKPVMHACGHDLHISSLLAATKLLHGCRDSWSGTVLALFQPNEERGAGAQAMVDDGLYDEGRHAIPKPDVVLGGHVMPMRAGVVSTRGGLFNGAANSVRATLYGRGGHGARPHRTVDPVILASSTVMRLQTIVSRETDPQEAVVVTVGAMHAGTAENVIGSEATLHINTRTFSKPSRERVRAAIERIVHAECAASGSPKPPLIEDTSSFPLLYNDEEAAQTVSKAMRAHFGGNFDPNTATSTGSEDFANLADPISAPYCFWVYGGIDPQLWDAAEKKGTLDEDIAGMYLAPSYFPRLFGRLT
jgi:amidohydrolase